jgi:hypothetical protein
MHNNKFLNELKYFDQKMIQIPEDFFLRKIRNPEL